MGTVSRGFHRLRLLLVAMPLLAGLYEAYAASPALEHQQAIAWLPTFVSQLALRLPLALILALVVYGLVTVVGAVLLRLHDVSIAAQAARNKIALSRPTRRHILRW
jgi:hypothetical protein